MAATMFIWYWGFYFGCVEWVLVKRFLTVLHCPFLVGDFLFYCFSFWEALKGGFD
jgi:hypothetical protein